MMQDDDRLLEALAGLPPIAPDIEWETRVRARCHTAISRRASRRARAGRNLFRAKLVDLAAATALCVYLAAVLIEAARLGGSL
jgi:hypothetical protein